MVETLKLLTKKYRDKISGGIQQKYYLHCSSVSCQLILCAYREISGDKLKLGLVESAYRCEIAHTQVMGKCQPLHHFILINNCVELILKSGS